jgi:alanine racemase
MVYTRSKTVVLDEDALINNLEVVKKYSVNCGILAIIKSNAYGHGILNIAKILNKENIRFGVSSLDEAVLLRKAGFKQQILLLSGAFWFNNIVLIIQYKITIIIGSIHEFNLLLSWIKRNNLVKLIKVHIDIDTGIGRSGFVAEQLILLSKEFKQVAAQTKIIIEGVSTHFACANNKDLNYTKMQINRFIMALSIMDDFGIAYDIIHLANSAAILRGLSCGGNLFFKLFNKKNFWVRPGLMLFGINPIPLIVSNSKYKLKPVLSLTSVITSLKKLSKYENIGYCATHKTITNVWIATLPIGYGDGIPLCLSNKAYVLINGIKVPIVGQISMNLITIDVTEVVLHYSRSSCYPGTKVTLIGKNRNKNIEIMSWVKNNTIIYEVLTNLNKLFTNH